MNNSIFIQWVANLLGKQSNSYSVKSNIINLNISPKNIKSVIFFLKNNTNTQFNILSDITCVDIFTKKKRFVIVYQLISLQFSQKLSIRINISHSIESITCVFNAANWYEREVFDIFGIFFKKHPDLRRILTDYGFEGYPMRKDFPLSGFSEIRYDFKKKRITCEPIELSQEFRNFYYIFPKKTEINSYQNFFSNLL